MRGYQGYPIGLPQEEKEEGPQLAILGLAGKSSRQWLRYFSVCELLLFLGAGAMGDFYASLERYLPDLSRMERQVIIEKIGEGWSEERLKPLLRMTADGMKKAVFQEISPTTD